MRVLFGGRLVVNGARRKTDALFVVCEFRRPCRKEVLCVQCAVHGAVTKPSMMYGVASCPAGKGGRPSIQTCTQLRAPSLVFLYSSHRQ